jgi:protein-disulfide isomerase
MARKGEVRSKRQEIREQRLRRQRRQRLSIIIGIAAIALILVAIIAIPNILQANAPVGDIVEITPIARPAVDGRALGPEDAPVVVEVFEDFQCPQCARFSSETEPQIVDNYVEAGQVRYIFRHYPFLDDQAPGSESDQPANASMCAAEQGRFWDYHDIVFANWDGENQGSFRDRRLVAFAESIGLDMEQFNQCFAANTYEDEIQADLNRGVQFGVGGTPTIFVNESLVGNPGMVPGYPEIQAAIEAALGNQQ